MVEVGIYLGTSQGYPMAQSYYCQLKNNSGLALRVVVISKYGQGHYSLGGSETIWVRFMQGKKVMLAWDEQNGELLDFHAIQVNKSALYRVLMSAPPQEGQPGGGLPAPVPVATYSTDTGSDLEGNVGGNVVDSGT